MEEFYKRRAGKQLLILAAVAVFIGTLGFHFVDEIFKFADRMSGDRSKLLLITSFVGGFVSFIYSMLRIYDLRIEMTLQQRESQRADFIATHDHLTKLPNRYAFERLKIVSDLQTDEENSLKTITIFSIDLDGFKKVNDLVGHQGGDKLLEEAAKRLSGFAAADCVFRFGGDEFIIVARALPGERENKFAKLVIQSLTRPIQIGDVWCQVGASVGYARWPDHGATLSEVCHRSDIALYEAKGTGANTALLFEHEMQNKVSARAQLEGKLREAIEEHRIRAFYQPLIDLRTGDICGFEALARWQEDDGSFVSPQAFISIAEETGLITPLFQQLLLSACQDAKLWPNNIMLSFNLSPVQMEDRLLASRILDILRLANLSPERLEIEITENALMHDPELAVAIIDELHQAGIQISLDDFGTGYSSLAQLARYKFDKLKIDRSFVQAFCGDNRHEKIVQAILNLSRGLNIKSTVEGIEEHSQLAYFLQQGCDFAQGYLFGKAMPAAETVQFLKHRQETKRQTSYLPMTTKAKY